MGEENFFRKSRRHKRKQHNESTEDLQITKNPKLSTSINKSAKKIQLCKQNTLKKYPKRSAKNNQLCKAAPLYPKNEGEKMTKENFLKKSKKHKRKRHDSVENIQVKKSRKLSTSVNKCAMETHCCRKNSLKKCPKKSANCNQLRKPTVLSPKNENSKTVFSIVESKRTSPRLLKMVKVNYDETKNKYSSDNDNLKLDKSVLKKRKNKLPIKKTSKVMARRYTLPLEAGYRKSLKSNKFDKKQASLTKNSYDLKNFPIDHLDSEDNKMAVAALYTSNFKHLKSVPVDDLFKLKPSENCQVTKIARKTSDNLTLNKIKNSESPYTLLKDVPCGISKRNFKIRISDTVSEEFQSKCNEIVPDFNDGLKKRPRRRTLKHKRWLFEKLRDNCNGYEDDIYESKSFDSYRCLNQLESESEASFSIATPQCLAVTPFALNKTPAFKDCFSPTELMRNRKHAEEYMYRRQKRKIESEKSQVQEPEFPEKKKLDFEEALAIITDKQNRQEESVNQSDSSDEENLSDT